MNWKLIFSLSLFGLAIAFATVSLIPPNVELVVWLVISVICAYIIAKKCMGKYFLHGFMVSIFNSVWITAVHIIFFTTYMANHPDMADMTTKMPGHPRLMMLIVGPVTGAVAGFILGLFAFIASKIVKKQPQTT